MINGLNAVGVENFQPHDVDGVEYVNIKYVDAEIVGAENLLPLRRWQRSMVTQRTHALKPIGSTGQETINNMLNGMIRVGVENFQPHDVDGVEYVNIKYVDAEIVGAENFLPLRRTQPSNASKRSNALIINKPQCIN